MDSEAPRDKLAAHQPIGYAAPLCASSRMALTPFAQPLTSRPSRTQVTEIAFTPGVTLVGPLPGECELVTPYGVAVATRAQQPELAVRFAALLAAAESGELRGRCGFEI